VRHQADADDGVEMPIREGHVQKIAGLEAHLVRQWPGVPALPTARVAAKDRHLAAMPRQRRHHLQMPPSGIQDGAPERAWWLA
jgi:hypothetical protein